MDELLTLAAAVGEALKERGETVAVAESSSGGLIAAALLSVPGASAYFRGGGTVYTGDAKRVLMGLTQEAMEADRAATEPHALQLADAARTQLDATWGIGETGAAGPTGNRYGDAAGHCCIGVTGPASKAATLATGSEGRYENMIAFAEGALRLLQECLGE
jgi:PncC family amidohydrolase